MLKEEPELKHISALSVTRENVLEWFEFKPEGPLFGGRLRLWALTGLLQQAG